MAAATVDPYFDYICVIDFEATCDFNATEYPHEIIEFPIVLINLRTRRIEDHFRSYVRPVINPVLSKYCVQLTGITQHQVDNSDTFPVVLKKVNEWFAKKKLGSRLRFCCASDGPWDFEKFLNLQCKHSDLPFPYWARCWINIRKLFASWYKTKECSLVKMLEYLSLEFEGEPHSGLDDAKNIARILMDLINEGCEIKLNDFLRTCMCSNIEKSHFGDYFRDAPCTEELDFSTTSFEKHLGPNKYS